ncbi:MAG: recombination mediator RecR [Lachnospiraceae bacterium]|nr:recombination mediator RecR [Lachnospiraceae bacterium]
MDTYNSSINRLTEELSRLPGIGRHTAQRLSFYLISQPRERVKSLSDALMDAVENVRYCKECMNLTDAEMCPVCSDQKRDHSIIMVVENPRDLAAYERTGRYRGVYHVLHGNISPMLGTGPSDIRLKELMERISREDISEVIIATNSSLEGETTAMYISRLVKPAGVKCSRIASGVPVGGDLENIDEVTLLRALEGRKEI